jgi:hypothetical protein
MKSSLKYKTTKAEWFEHKFKYNGLMDMDKQSRDTKPLDEKTTKSLGSYATYTLFYTNNTDTYKLYNEWTLDGGLDVHVCNDTGRNGFRKTRDALLDD